MRPVLRPQGGVGEGEDLQATSARVLEQSCARPAPWSMAWKNVRPSLASLTMQGEQDRCQCKEFALRRNYLPFYPPGFHLTFSYRVVRKESDRVAIADLLPRASLQKHRHPDLEWGLTVIDESEIQNRAISLVQHFYNGTMIKLNPGSELGSFDLGSGKMLRFELRVTLSPWGRGGAVVRLLAFHLGELRSIRGAVASGFSHVGFVPDDFSGWRVFSGFSLFPHPFITALLHSHPTLLSLGLKTSMLRATQIYLLQLTTPWSNWTKAGIIYAIQSAGLHKCGVVMPPFPSQASRRYTLFMVRILASHQGGPGSIPGFSHVGIVPDDAGFSRVSTVSPALAFRHCSILTLLHPHRLLRPRRQEPPKSLHSLLSKDKYLTCALAYQTEGLIRLDRGGAIKLKAILHPLLQVCAPHVMYETSVRCARRRGDTSTTSEYCFIASSYQLTYFMAERFFSSSVLDVLKLGDLSTIHSEQERDYRLAFNKDGLSVILAVGTPEFREIISAHARFQRPTSTPAVVVCLLVPCLCEKSLSYFTGQSKLGSSDTARLWFDTQDAYHVDRSIPLDEERRGAVTSQRTNERTVYNGSDGSKVFGGTVSAIRSVADRRGGELTGLLHDDVNRTLKGDSYLAFVVRHDDDQHMAVLINPAVVEASYIRAGGELMPARSSGTSTTTLVVKAAQVGPSDREHAAYKQGKWETRNLRGTGIVKYGRCATAAQRNKGCLKVQLSYSSGVTAQKHKPLTVMDGASDCKAPARLPPRRTGFHPRPGNSRILASGNRVGLCRWMAGFLEDIPLLPPFNSGAAPYSPQSHSSALRTSLSQSLRAEPRPASQELRAYFASVKFSSLWLATRAEGRGGLRTRAGTLELSSHPHVLADVGVLGMLGGKYARLFRFPIIILKRISFLCNHGATVAERLACSPLTKANRVQSLAASLQIFASVNRTGRCRWSAGFLGGLPLPPPFHSGAAPYSPHFTLIGSQDHDIKSHPDLFTHSFL
ncbi:hypothetical protein PR048_026424 [Dryococelus australis]|uniref:Uncharacterized protein n=1 Tax=Dryococelus australis TaxID=614101 RepID=A0ABQ9GLA2_9NEOP|nr:hypothetical protein PR048_026424 [Dryococelus australis]